MSHPASARLFIALDLPSGLRQELNSWARCALRAAASAPPEPVVRRGRRAARPEHRAAGRLHGIRTLDAELMHVTLAFLGSRPVEEIGPLCGIVELCAAPQMGEVSIGAPLWLPPRRPRALAVELHDDDGCLADLHRTLERDLRAGGLISATPNHGEGHRAFRPHVTVARLRQGAVPRDRILEPTPRRAFVPQRLVLYRSWLSPEGASYEPLAASMIAPEAPGAQAA
jgi:2'-5' RNA ligase